MCSVNSFSDFILSVHFVSVLDEIHWKRVGSAENEKEWATAHFHVSVEIDNFGSMS